MVIFWCYFFVNKVIKGTATKANLITNAIYNKPQLVGIDNIDSSCLGALWVELIFFRKMKKSNH